MSDLKIHEMKARSSVAKYWQQQYRRAQGERDKWRLKLFETRCSEHSRSGKEGNLPLYCATCGKPMVGVPPKMTYKELRVERDKWRRMAQGYDLEAEQYAHKYFALRDDVEEINRKLGRALQRIKQLEERR